MSLAFPIPDKPYDLTTLQREANKYFGYSANDTVNLAQALYEKKLITYPRTDSRYLTDDMVNTIKELLEGLEDDFKINESNFKSIFNSSITALPLALKLNLSYSYLIFLLDSFKLSEHEASNLFLIRL